MQNIDWDCFRYITAIVDHGSASAAASILDVDASTVQRKIARFERDHGVTLFERRRSGYTPTLECSAIIDAARSMEESVNSINRTILGQDLRLEGAVSITTTDSIAHSILMPHIVAYREAHPSIVLDLTITNSRLNLSRLDADIAIRPSRNPPENLIGENVSSLATAIYGHPILGEGDVAPNNKKLPWIGIGDDLAGSPAHSWMEQNVAASQIAMSANTFPAMAALCEQGAGLALLPCPLGDANNDLIRRSNPIPQCATDLWVLTHPDTRQSARIRSVVSFLVKRLKANAAKLEGTLPVRTTSNE